MKWMQLYDLVRQTVDVVTAEDEEIEAVVSGNGRQRPAMGLVRRGLSRPRDLPFLPTARHRVDERLRHDRGDRWDHHDTPGPLQGGLIWEPPLPGIEISLAEDGELKIRGPYVMPGLLNPPEGSQPFDADGWFPTGDLMEQDADGFIRIVDRKKEIYKNINGQTIAPQKIENLFRDFDSVGRIFLVGDHRAYNTALIYPNPEDETLDRRDPVRRRNSKATSDRWSSAPILSSPPMSGSSTSRSSTVTSTPSRASSPPKEHSGEKRSSAHSPTRSGSSIAAAG